MPPQQIVNNKILQAPKCDSPFNIISSRPCHAFYRVFTGRIPGSSEEDKSAWKGNCVVCNEPETLGSGEEDDWRLEAVLCTACLVFETGTPAHFCAE